MSHVVISFDPHFVHCMSCTSTAISNRYIHSRQCDCFLLSADTFGDIFSSPKCNRSQLYHNWCTYMFSRLLYFFFLSFFFFSSSNFSSFLSSCLLKDNFASKPTDKHTMVHLNPHDLNLSHYYYIVQWKYICYLQCIRIAWIQLGSTQCFYGLRVRQIFLCVFKLKHRTCRG